MDGVPCRCAELEELDGPAGRTYAETHLFERAVGNGTDQQLVASGIRYWRCEATGWQFVSHPLAEGPLLRLRRLPFTTTDDYLDHDVVARRAAALARSTIGTDEHQEALDALYSPDLRTLIQSVNRNDPMGIEAAIVLLEVDPWCFRSGYLKVSAMDHLARARLQPSDRDRIQTALVAATLKGPRRADEHRSALRLARHVRSPAFAARLEALRAEVPAAKRPAVQRLLDALGESRRARTSRRRRRG
ncbi:MAG: hypothetical protein KDB04_04435 [Acidimicrobiales bacterium]|nr:hypothetical protein [Acidimicrobiales bacterium]